MLMLSKILVVVDPEEASQQALDKAVRLAQASGARLELLACDHNSYLEDGFYFDPPQATTLRQEHIERGRQWLEKIAAPLRQQGLGVDVDARWGHPAYQAVVDKILHSQPDLVVHSTRHHDRISRLLLSHQDWQLLRFCPCPLLLVKAQPWSQHPRFVVAVDPVHRNDKPAELDHQLVAAAHALSLLVDGELHLYHSCYQPPVSGLYPVTVDKSHSREKAAELLAAFTLPAARLHISEDEVQQSLPALLARTDASVLVMGAISRSAVARFLVGSTAEKILDRVDQDVLIVKPQGFTDKVKKATPESL